MDRLRRADRELDLVLSRRERHLDVPPVAAHGERREPMEIAKEAPLPLASELSGRGGHLEVRHRGKHRLRLHRVINEEKLIAAEVRSELLLLQRGHVAMDQRVELREDGRTVRRGFDRHRLPGGEPIALARERIGRRGDSPRRRALLQRAPVDLLARDPQLAELREVLPGDELRNGGAGRPRLRILLSNAVAPAVAPAPPAPAPTPLPPPLLPAPPDPTPGPRPPSASAPPSSRP